MKPCPNTLDEARAALRVQRAESRKAKRHCAALLVIIGLVAGRLAIASGAISTWLG